MKKVKMAFALVIIGLSINAQSITPDVIASDGNYSVYPGGSVAWTIGEPVTETYVAGTNILTTGFQQPNTVILNSIPEMQNGEVYLFPNPAENEITLDFAKMNPGEYMIWLYDEAGRLVLSVKAPVMTLPFQQKVNLEGIAKGLYLFKVTNKDLTVSKSFRITKL